MDPPGPTHAAEREALEAEVKARCAARDFDGAATAVIKGYGPEVYGFLVGLHRSEDDAAEVFSVVAEKVWRGLPKFAWAASARTWTYAIARQASLRWRRDAKGRQQRNVPLTGEASRLVAEVRTKTLTFLRTDRRDALARLRDALPAEDRMLLVLRVDRGLAWNDLARVLAEEEGDPDDATLKREAARLRKRFQLVKERLVEMGRKEGLLGGEGERGPSG